VRRQLEVTFQEMRRHLGFETHRQRFDTAIQRTSVALLGLFSLVELFAHQQIMALLARPPRNHEHELVVVAEQTSALLGATNEARTSA
jgi:hypothetical protein